MSRTPLALGLTAAGAAALLAALLTAPSVQAQSSGGGINPGIIRFCENQRNDGWATRHAPNDQTFFHQELVLGEGDYTLTVVPNGSFRFNVFVYQGDGERYIGGASDVPSFSQRLSAGSWDERFLVQLVKTTDTCPGCSVSMSLNAYNCSPSSSNTRAESRPPCSPGSCYVPPRQEIFGLPLDGDQCVPRAGAQGGVCGTPGN